MATMQRLGFMESESLLNGRPYVKSSELFLLQNPLPLISIVLLQLYIIIKLGPQFMANRKAFDLRPYMLVFNGLNFGTFGCGIVTFSYALSFCKDAWTCNSQLEGLTEWSVIYSAYLYLIMKVLENLSFLMMVLRKKPQQNPTACSIYSTANLVLLYLGLKYHPRNVFMMEPYIESWTTALKYAYYTLRAPHQAKKYLWLRKALIFTTIFADLLNIGHMSYLLSTGCSVSPLLMYGVIALKSGELTYFLHKLARGETRTSQAKSE